MSTYVQVLLDSLVVGSLYAIIALGVTLVIGIMGLVNFAYGELVMIGGYSIYLGLVWDVPAGLVIVAVFVAVVLLALVQERVVFRPLRSAAPETLLVGSFALSYLLQSATLVLGGTKPIGIPSIVDITPHAFLGVQASNLDLVTLGTAAVLFAGLAALLRFTNLGLQMRAAAEDFGMARLLGCKANFVIAAAFAVSGILAAAAAVILTAKTGTVTVASGQQLLLIAFVAAVIGGMGRLVGAILGAYLLALLSGVLQFVLPNELAVFRDALAFTIVIGVLVARPEGLSRRRLVLCVLNVFRVVDLKSWVHGESTCARVGAA